MRRKGFHLLGHFGHGLLVLGVAGGPGEVPELQLDRRHLWREKFVSLQRNKHFLMCVFGLTILDPIIG